MLQLCFDFYKSSAKAVKQFISKKKPVASVKKKVTNYLDQLSLDFTTALKVVFDAASGRYMVGKESFTTQIKAQFYLVALENGFSFS